MSHTPLPTGTVTFLFTDIEGSTRLLQHLGDRYADLLADQRSLLREAFERWHGHELGTEGDSFFVAFARATDALRAVVEAQRALAAHPWPEGISLRVRMGVHTGEPTLTPEGYVGLDVHRAARINGCAHGGQVLLSQRARDMVLGELPPGVSLRDVGAHRLKDLLHPERLFQVVIEGLPAEFPPLKSLSAHPNNLPLQLSRFIGRERELEEVRERLRETRLLTLTGAGGTGKTRLALQVGADRLEAYGDGVWFVELAAVIDPGLIPQAVASVFHLREEPGRPLTETLTDYLQPRELLLLLDNCEHLLEGCARLAASLLQRCPRFTLLATSREPLGLPGEQIWRVPSLPVPDPERLPGEERERVAAVTAYEGVRLFIDRAFFHQPRFAVTGANAAAVAEVCHRLDGIPLAIELAAARVKALPVETIADRLDDRFRLLTGGSRVSLPRQQTLRALIDWSYALLSSPERALLARLSVFAGGFQLSAAEAVCSDRGVRIADCGRAGDPLIRNPQFAIRNEEVLDLLTSLVEKSLVQYEESEGEGHYRLLETVRQYSREKLAEAGDEETRRERHREHYLRFAEQAEPELLRADQELWLARLAREHDNLRAALGGAIEQGEAEAALSLSGALWRLWEARGTLREGRGWLERALSLGVGGSPAARAKALNGAGNLARDMGDLAQARAWHEGSLRLRRALDDRRGIAISLHNLGNIAIDQGEYERAAALYEEGLALRRELGDRHGIALALNNLGLVARRRGDAARAAALCEESLAGFRQLQDKWGTALSLDVLGEVAQDLGEYERAAALHTESLALRRRLGNKAHIAVSLRNLGRVAVARRDFREARDRFGEALALGQELGDRPGIAQCLEGRALVAEAEGRPGQAARLLGAAQALRDAAGTPRAPGDVAGYERALAALRAALGEGAFAAAWAEGQAMPLEEAIRAALDEREG